MNFQTRKEGFRGDDILCYRTKAESELCFLKKEDR